MPALTHLSNDHDETLIARLAAGDLSAAEATQAGALTSSCPACAQLETDLRSIIAATSGLPAPRRTRDFRLTDADAARLRRTGWRRLVGRFGDPRLAFTRPLATGLLALGIAGLVFASAPSFLVAGGASTAAQAPVAGALSGLPGSSNADSSASGLEYGPGAAGGVDGGEPAASAPVPPLLPQPSPAASVAAAASSPGPAASTLPADVSSSAVAPSPVGILNLASGSVSAAPAPVFNANPGAGKSTGGAAEAPGGPSALVLTSLVLLVIGATLFVLRWAARRAT
jgi:hypothetical protein